MQGEKGEQGIQGEKGEQGIQGIQGEKGDKGEQGIQGEKGEKGDQGIQGEKGEKGDKGDKGDTGPAGGVNSVNGQQGDITGIATQEQIEALQAENSNLQTENSRLREDLNNTTLTVSAEGESIKLDGTAEATVKSIAIQGNSKQEEYEDIENPKEIKTVQSANIVGCNKNFLDLTKQPYSEASSTLNGGTVTIKDGIMTVDATNATGNMTVASQYVGYDNQNTLYIPVGSYYSDLRFNVKSVDGIKSGQFGGAFEFDRDMMISQWFATVQAGEKKTFKLQLEQNSNGTDYVEHKSQTVSIATQQEMLENDEFEKIDGKWKEKHTWEKVVLTGDEEGWVSALNDFETDDTIIVKNSNIFKNFKVNENGIATITSKIYCTHFKNITGVELRDNSTVGITTWDNTGVGIIIRTKANTVEEFTEFLKEQYNAGTPVVIYYQLAEPIYLECTTEQIEALNELEKLKTYKDVTHFYSTDEVKAIMSVQAIKDLEQVTSITNLEKFRNKYRYLISTFYGSYRSGLILLGTNDLKTFDLLHKQGIYRVQKNVSDTIDSSLRDPALIKIGERKNEREWYYYTYTIIAFNSGSNKIGFCRTKDFDTFEELDNLSLQDNTKDEYDYVWAPDWFRYNGNIYVLGSCKNNSGFSTVIAKYNVENHTLENGTTLLSGNDNGIDFHMYFENGYFYLVGAGGLIYKSSSISGNFEKISTNLTTGYEADFLVKKDDGGWRLFRQQLGVSFDGHAHLCYNDADTLESEWSDTKFINYTDSALEYIKEINSYAQQGKSEYFHFTVFDFMNRNGNNNNFVD